MVLGMRPCSPAPAEQDAGGIGRYIHTPERWAGAMLLVALGFLLLHRSPGGGAVRADPAMLYASSRTNLHHPTPAAAPTAVPGRALHTSAPTAAPADPPTPLRKRVVVPALGPRPVALRPQHTASLFSRSAAMQEGTPALPVLGKWASAAVCVGTCAALMWAMARRRWSARPSAVPPQIQDMGAVTDTTDRCLWTGAACGRGRPAWAMATVAPEAAPSPPKAAKVASMRLDRLLGNLGYGTRKELAPLIKKGHVLLDDQPLKNPGQRVALTPDLPDRLTVDGEPLDPLPGLTLLLHKPLGVTCSHRDEGRLVYDLLPGRWQQRKPALSTVGRLDKETSGLLLLTDDGALLHTLTSPKRHVGKRYRVTLARPLTGEEAAVFASGSLMLEGETRPLRPAILERLSDTTATVVITEGRYHQIRRMFAAVGNHVTQLHRESMGGLALPADLEPGDYRVPTPEELAQIAQGEPVGSPLIVDDERRYTRTAPHPDRSQRPEKPSKRRSVRFGTRRMRSSATDEE